MSGGGGGGGGSRVPIPNNVRKIVQDIREITVKQHTDDEIYAVLRECSMDPNETAQKLLYLDTFHEVRRKRDKKKEGLGSGASEESRSNQGGHRRGGRAPGPGGYSFNFHDGGGGKNLPIRRENGVIHIAEKNNAPSKADLQKKTITTPEVTRVSAVVPLSAANQSNGKSGHATAGQPLIGVVNVSKSSSAAKDIGNQENVQPQAAIVAIAASPTQTIGSVTSTDQVKSLSSSDQLQTLISGVYSSSSDPVLAPSISRNPGVGSAISREVGSNRVSAEPNHAKGIKLEEAGDLSASKNEKSGSTNSTRNFNATKKSNEVESNQLSNPSQLSSSSLNGSLRSSSGCGIQPPPPANVIDVSISEACVQSSAELRQHVTFPNHFQVPEALKSGLTFGSFDTFGPSERSSSGTGCEDNTYPTGESSIGNDEAANSSNQSASLTEQGDHLDYLHSSSLIRKTPATEGNSITGTDSKTDQPKQEPLLAPEGHPIMNVQSAQNYGLNFMSTMLGTQQVQFEGTEPQVPDTTRFPSFVSASSQAVSPSPTPPLQSSIPVPPQSIPIFRPPYPPNFFPYGPFYPPFYLSPMHQFLGHNGFPQQPSAANMYHLPPAAAAAAGIKFPPPQYKAGANTGNTAHIGIPPGSFITPPVGYAPSPTVNTGSSSGHEDLVESQLKENQIYTTGQSEGSAVWIQAPGQDISSLQVNSMYNLTPQGHLAFPQAQASHAAFAAMYQPAQTVASPSTLLQQSQAMAGPVETVGPPAGSYQQPQAQPSQMNWNSNF